MDHSSADRLAANWDAVQRSIDQAARAAGRSPDDVRLVAVTKYADAEAISVLYELGCRDFGESRPQALWAKSEQLADLPDLKWHFIGHLQRNKVARTLPLVHLLHSGDSLRLLQAADAARSAPLDVLLEVNVSGDETKGGFAPHAVRDDMPRLAELKNLRIVGLMAMAARSGGAERARQDFASLRRLRDEMAGDLPPGMALRELSMGMSGDFAEAIAEGATLVRIGSALVEDVA